MKIVFLSDAHLHGPGYEGRENLRFFFEQLRGRRGEEKNGRALNTLTLDHLVIAGDFFDFWFSRRQRIYPGFDPVVERLAALKREGVRISLCEGNHDFSLTEYFARELGMDVYPEWAEWCVDGLRILVSHGDTVDQGNRRYLLLRRFLRSRPAFWVQKTLPLALLWRLACFSSQMSRNMTAESRERLTHLMDDFAQRKFADGYDAVILGHCHKASLRTISMGGREKTFVTLGDWITHDSYLLLDHGRFTLQRFSPR
jgi:UDP-2,3-diacylglucosamine hydrolase